MMIEWKLSNPLTRDPRTEKSLILTTDETYETDSSRSSKSHSADLTLLLSSDVSSLARDPFGVWASIRWRHSSNFVEQFETAELTSSRTTKYGSSIDISHLSKSSKDHHLIRPPIRIQNYANKTKSRRMSLFLFRNWRFGENERKRSWWGHNRVERGQLYNFQLFCQFWNSGDFLKQRCCV